MEDGCSVGIGDDKLLAIGGYWETKQVIMTSMHQSKNFDKHKSTEKSKVS